MKKIYKTYIIQTRKNNKCVILGLDENYKAFKVMECKSEVEAEKIRSAFQRKSSIYYDLNIQISNVITNYKARTNRADIIALDFDDIVDMVLKEFQTNLMRKRILVSNIINESDSSSLAIKQ